MRQRSLQKMRRGLGVWKTLSHPSNAQVLVKSTPVVARRGRLAARCAWTEQTRDGLYIESLVVHPSTEHTLSGPYVLIALLPPDDGRRSGG